MSATLDSDLLAQYFSNCQTLAAGGRTHPVDHFFLEDVFEMTEYRLDADGPAALRVIAGSSKGKALQKASTSKQKLVKVVNSSYQLELLCTGLFCTLLWLAILSHRQQ